MACVKTPRPAVIQPPRSASTLEPEHDGESIVPGILVPTVSNLLFVYARDVDQGSVTRFSATTTRASL